MPTGSRSAIRSAVLLPIPVGGLAAVAAHLILPPTGGDPLRSTLVVLPVVAAALVAIGRWAEAHGGRRCHARPAAAELVVAGSLVLLALGRSSLGLQFGHLEAPLIFVGLCLALGWRVGRLVLALRPSLGSRLPDRPPWVFFFLPLAVYVAILPWSTEQRPPDGDEPWYLLITHSLAYDFDESLSNNYAQGDSLSFLDRRLGPQPGDPVDADGEAFSRHNLTLPVLLAPAYRLAGKLGALTVMAMLAAALCRETLRLARHYRPASPGTALAAWAILAFTAPLLLYSHQVWVEVPAALLAVIAIERIQHLRGTGSPTAGDWLVLAATLALLPLLKFRLAVVGGGLALLILVVGWRRRRRLVGFLVGVFTAAAGSVLVINYLLFGNPLRYYRFTAILGLYQTSPLTYLRGLVGMLGDSAFGLIAYAPIWLLLVAALPGALRRPRPLLDFGLVFGPYLILFGPRAQWFGGWSPPFRYAMVALPMLALLLEPVLAGRQRRGARIAGVLLGALTVALTLVWLALPGWTYNLADGRTHLLDFLSRLLASDAARFFPSYVRLRPAAWIWPPAVLLLAVVWRLGRRSPAVVGRWGVALLLALAAMLPVAAHRLPSRTIEFEDPYVAKSGGSLHPDRWMRGRPRFRGGWRAPPGTRLTAAVVPAGEALAVSLDLSRPGARGPDLEVEVREGDEVRARVRLDDTQGWRRVELGPFTWRGSRAVTFEVTAAGGAREAQARAVLLDRARLSWSRATAP